LNNKNEKKRKFDISIPGKVFYTFEGLRFAGNLSYSIIYHTKRTVRPVPPIEQTPLKSPQPSTSIKHVKLFVFKSQEK
jgi:hypothetical protein